MKFDIALVAALSLLASCSASPADPFLIRQAKPRDNATSFPITGTSTFAHLPLTSPYYANSSTSLNKTTSVASSAPSSAPLTNTIGRNTLPTPTLLSSASSTISSAAPTITVSGGATIIVPFGAIVYGGPRGGFANVAGVLIPVAVGQTITAGESLGDPPNKPTPTTEDAKPTSSSLSTSSSIPSGTLLPYIIFPRKKLSIDDQNSLILFVDQQLHGENYLTTTIPSLGGLQFISANMTEPQANACRKHKLVRAVASDGNGHEVPLENQQKLIGAQKKKWLQRRETIVQADSLPQLNIISNPPNNLDTMADYTFDDSAGKGITVYVIDTGYYTGSPEYQNSAVPPRWLFTQPDLSWGGTRKDLSFFSGHGSCTGSIVNSPSYGVAKGVDLVVVQARMTDTSLLSAFAEVILDVESQHLQGKAVINFSISFASGTDPDILDECYTYLEELIALDVIFVCTAGNENIDIDRYPALWADTLPIIVVGAVNNTGFNHTRSKGGPLVTVGAPGVDVTCAQNLLIPQIASGTSVAAPAVAGLAAYFLGLGPSKYPEIFREKEVAQNMKDLIVKMAYPRQEGHLPVIYNGNIKEGTSCSRGSARFRRQDGSQQSCSVTSSASISPAIPTSSTAPTTVPTTALAPAQPTGCLEVKDFPFFADSSLELTICADPQLTDSKSGLAASYTTCDSDTGGYTIKLQSSATQNIIVGFVGTFFRVTPGETCMLENTLGPSACSALIVLPLKLES